MGRARLRAILLWGLRISLEQARSFGWTYRACMSFAWQRRKRGNPSKNFPDWSVARLCTH